MPKKRPDDTELWIMELDGNLIEFDDFVFGERDEDLDKTMTCYKNKEIVYSGKTSSFHRKDSWKHFHETEKD